MPTSLGFLLESWIPSSVAPQVSPWILSFLHLWIFFCCRVCIDIVDTDTTNSQFEIYYICGIFVTIQFQPTSHLLGLFCFTNSYCYWAFLSILYYYDPTTLKMQSLWKGLYQFILLIIREHKWNKEAVLPLGFLEPCTSSEAFSYNQLSEKPKCVCSQTSGKYCHGLLNGNTSWRMEKPTP